MILRRITQHVKEQNWFAVVLDFIIVVLGIWVALKAGEWAEARRNQAELVRVSAELNDEILPSYYYAHERLAFAPCRMERYKELGNLLVNSTGDWPGAPGNYGEGRLTKSRVFPLVLRSPSRPFTSIEWNAAISSGVLDVMDAKRRGDLARHYQAAARITELHGELHRHEARMQALYYPSQLTPSDRLRYHEVLAEADALAAGVELIAEQMISNIETNELVTFSEEQRRSWQEFIDQGNRLRKDIYGDCGGDIALPLLNRN